MWRSRLKRRGLVLILQINVSINIDKPTLNSSSRTAPHLILLPIGPYSTLGDIEGLAAGQERDVMRWRW